MSRFWPGSDSVTPDEQAGKLVQHLVDTYPTVTLRAAVSATLTDLLAQCARGDIDDATYLAGVRAVADVIAERAS